MIRTTLAEGAPWPVYTQRNPDAIVDTRTQLEKVRDYMKTHPGQEVDQIAAGISMQENRVRNSLRKMAKEVRWEPGPREYVRGQFARIWFWTGEKQ